MHLNVDETSRHTDCVKACQKRILRTLKTEIMDRIKTAPSYIVNTGTGISTGHFKEGHKN